jgi:hypothetical protein
MELVFWQHWSPLSGHEVVPGGHVMPASRAVPLQAPLEQSCPGGQTLPHAPQLVKSELVFTQNGIPLIGHEVVPGGHEMPASKAVPVQMPLEQSCPRAQTLPHAPQLLGSKRASTQAGMPPSWEQEMNGAGQLHDASGSAGSASGDVDCASGVLLPEHAAIAIVPTTETTANVAAHQRREEVLSSIMSLSSGGERVRCRRHPNG